VNQVAEDQSIAAKFKNFIYPDNHMKRKIDVNNLARIFRSFDRLPVCLLILVFLSGCSFKFEVTSQRTALENQILGEYQELEDDLALVSSVRGGGSRTKFSLAERSKQNQRFNLDDIEELKNIELLGETVKGRLVLLKKSVGRRDDASKFQIKIARILVQEENRDRVNIWNYIISSNENISASNLIELKKTFALQKRKDGKVGHWFQDQAGKWQQKQTN